MSLRNTLDIDPNSVGSNVNCLSAGLLCYVKLHFDNTHTFDGKLMTSDRYMQQLISADNVHCIFTNN